MNKTENKTNIDRYIEVALHKLNVIKNMMNSSYFYVTSLAFPCILDLKLQ